MLGGNMSALGIMIDHFEIPVCNSFRAKIRNDQLCYEVDLKKISNKNNIENELKLGFVFLMDYNEDRQVTFNFSKHLLKRNNTFVENLLQLKDEEHAYIYINTIGKYLMQI